MQDERLSRRRILQSAAALTSVAVLPRAASAQAEPPPSRLVKRVVKTPPNTYSTYPHANGFLPDGRCVIASPTNGPKAPDLDYIAFDLDRGTSSLLAHARDARTYWAVSRNGVMAFPTKSGVSVVDLSSRGAQPKHLFDDQPWTVAGDLDITPDGTQILITRSHYQRPQDYQTALVDLQSGEVQPLLDPGWPMDHAHFSPYDPTWICYADNRPKLPDRLWVWNRQSAPQGKHLFNQVKPDGTSYDIGHERAMFNKRALLVIAYGGHSTAHPCGLFEVSFAGDVRLVSPSEQDFHCNVSRDGRWAVVSLQGAMNQGLRRASPTWMKEGGGGFGFSDVMLVDMRSGRRAFLYRATNSSEGQPYEVQPTISPDGRYVLCKDAREQNVHAIELNQQELGAFLGA